MFEHDDDDIESLPAWANPLRDSHQREVASEDLGIARCPWCDGPLRVVMDGRGPHFTCPCEERRVA